MLTATKMEVKDKQKRIVKEIKIPSGVDVAINYYFLKAKGPKGEITRDFSNPRLIIEKKDNSVIVSSPMKKQTKRDSMFINSCVSNIKNILLGVQGGYEAKMKICSGHFPMSVTIDNKFILVKNFLGEKIPRKTSLLEGVNVKVEGDIIKINGCSKEKVGLAAARIEKLCHIRNKDLRVFQDGIWLTEKAHEVKNG